MNYTTTFPRGARWTPGKLVYLREAQKRGADQQTLAHELGVERRDIDIASWALLGRSLTQACDLLNGVTP